MSMTRRLEVGRHSTTAPSSEKCDVAARRGARKYGERILVGGVEFDALTEAEVIAIVLRSVEQGRGGTVVTPNVDILRQLQDPQMRNVAQTAELVLADGYPVVLASRILRTPLPERVTGASLIGKLSKEAMIQSRRVLLLGGLPGAASSAVDTLVREFPDQSPLVAHHFPPYGFESQPDALAQIDRAIEQHDPDIVFVGLGFPKQDLLSADLARKFPSSWFIGCGGSIDLLGGQASRAPRWMQQHGLEWLYRLAREPRRLYRRYLIHDIPYAIRLLLRSVVARLY